MEYGMWNAGYEVCLIIFLNRKNNYPKKETNLNKCYICEKGLIGIKN